MADGRAVLFLVPRSKNPYQTLLAAALQEQGIEVRMAPPTGVWPFWSGLARNQWPAVVHLHWAHPLIDRVVPILRVPNHPLAAVAAARALGEVAALKRCGIRFVWTVHNIVSHEGRHGALEWAFNRSLARLCDSLVVHYPEAADTVRAAYRLPASHPVAVVPHAHYAGYYADTIGRDAARRRLGLDQGERVFLFLGAIRAYKDVGTLVEAFRGIDAPRARLVIAGRASSAERRTLESMTQGDRRILLHPTFVPDDEVQVYMRAADAVVQPAAEILTSGSAILAMSFGKALLGSRTPHLRFLLEDSQGGILYDATETGQLRQALQDALAADLVSMGARNARAIAQWTWNRMAIETRAVYEAIVSA